MPEEPVTFREPCWVIFNISENGVAMTPHGNLAIFNTKAMAEAYVLRAGPNFKVMPVTVRPIAVH